MISPNMVVDGLTWREVTGSGTGKQVSIIIFGIFNIYVYYTQWTPLKRTFAVIYSCLSYRTRHCCQQLLNEM